MASRVTWISPTPVGGHYMEYGVYSQYSLNTVIECDVYKIHQGARKGSKSPWYLAFIIPSRLPILPTSYIVQSEGQLTKRGLLYFV